MYRNKIALLCFFCLLSIPQYAASIKGRVVLSDDWSPVVYISVIQSFDHLYTASYDFLRYQVELDSTGYFEIDSMQLLSDDRIYRLHVCKKGDPVSTIMIGGQEENFVHFIMNNNSSIELLKSNPNEGLQHCEMSGQPFGNALSNLFALQERLNTRPALPSAQNRAFIKQQVLTELKGIARSSSSDIIRLLALHFINESFVTIDHLDIMEIVYNDLSAKNSANPYFDAFAKEYNFLLYQKKKKTRTSSGGWLLYLLLIPVIGFVYWWLFRRNPQLRRKSDEQKVQSLSNQEKKVLSLLKKGKTNKEISSELHIEVSTVKSHLNKIYSRLGVKSRKEIIDK